MERKNMNYYDNGRQYAPIDVIKDWQLNFNLGNAVKYIARAGRKDPDAYRVDIYKAISYLAHEVGDVDIFNKATANKSTP